MRHLSVLALSLLVTLVASLSACSAPQPTYAEQYRPAYHFTPARNWINDPNGLVFYDGEYHLFFQYNPRGQRWGHLSWGHAVSDDLVNWRELDIAIPERDVMIFSGSSVIDWRNSAGFGGADAPAMVAIYTGYNPRTDAESQFLSFSLDRGRTWREYDGNPIIEQPRAGAFRDPKVFWHEATSRWIMTLVHSNERRVAFYVSENLKAWREVSTFGPAGLVGGPWETPELFELPVEGGGTRWVLSVGVTGRAGLTGGSGVQYFVGVFDGERFVADGGAHVGDISWADYGGDFYAPQTWSGIPAEDGRRIWIAWMSNTLYANDTPTRPWRGMMTVPRELVLVESGGRLMLSQRPVRELESLRREEVVLASRGAGEAAALAEVTSLGGAAEYDLAFTPPQSGEVGLLLRYGEESAIRIGYDADNGHAFVDRAQGGDFDADTFRARHYAPADVEGGVVRMRVLLDHSSIEVFADGGVRVLSSLIFPDGPLGQVALYATGEGAALSELRAWRMAPMERTAQP